MSLWGDYIKEKYNKNTIETDVGFVTYKIVSEGKEFYVDDIYIKPEFRGTGSVLSFICDLIKIVEENGCDRVTCCVFATSNNCEEPLIWLLKMGFKIATILENSRIFLYIYAEDFKEKHKHHFKFKE